MLTPLLEFLYNKAADSCNAAEAIVKLRIPHVTSIESKVVPNRTSFKEIPREALGHSLDHEPQGNCILNFKIVQLA
jgi:hypothetical protein